MPCRLALHGELGWRVAQKLALQWLSEVGGQVLGKFESLSLCLEVREVLA
jgi:hypothetical protein